MNKRTSAIRSGAGKGAGKGAAAKGAARGNAAGKSKGTRAEAASLRVMAQGRAANAEHRQAAQTMGRLLREVCGIVALFAALIALLALVTFDQNDPGWSHTGESQAIHNSVGRAGAWFADVAFYLVGFMAYLMPLLLAFSGWALFRSARRKAPAYRPFVFVRLIGVALMFAAASGLADLHAGVPEGALPEGTFGGGILGTVTAWRLVAFLHPLGATLLLLGLFFCSLTLAFGTSWIQLIEWLGSGVLRTVDWVRDQYSSTADARRELELRRRELFGDRSDHECYDDLVDDSTADEDAIGVAGRHSARGVSTLRRSVDESAGKRRVASGSQETGVLSGLSGKSGKSRLSAGDAPDINFDVLPDYGQASVAGAASADADTGDGIGPGKDGKSGKAGQIEKRNRNGKAARRWIGLRKDGDEADPLLDILPEDLPDEKPKVGLAAALELARSSARRGEPAAGEGESGLARAVGDTGADKNGRIPLGNRPGSSSEKFDAMADALDQSMSLDGNSAASREPGNRAVLKAARALKIAERADRAEPVISDYDPLAAATAMVVPAGDGSEADIEARSAYSSGTSTDVGESLVTAAPSAVDVDTPTVKSAPKIKPRPPEQKQAKLFLNVPDSDLPPLSLLDAPEPQRAGFSRDELEALSRLLEEKLAEFRIEVEVVAVHPGPVITSFEMQPAPGIKASRITGLAQDIARSMSLPSVRVVEVIPGKSTIGIEVPNDHREIVQLSEMLQSEGYAKQKSPLTLALGKDISGQAVMADLARMPHLLVAGTTGSGKSVAVNAMLISLLYKATAKDVRLILIDPKMLELNVYDDIPHLLSPVVTDMSEAANALRWCVGEMERRYTVMAALKVRNLAGYNKKINDAQASGVPLTDPLWQAELSLDPSGPPPVLEPMPMIVVVVDEFADMMMQVGKKAEELITRIAQKARAAGIHLILATQRPSVDVITGLIKANVPSRIAFQVSQKVDSRTIIDQGGAESLLGHGDMLYLPPGSGVPVRVHGAFVDDHEVHNVVSHIKQTGEPNYIEEILQESTASIPGISGGSSESDAETDPLYDQAVAVVLESRKASISYVQRRLKIGYNRAARMIEDMENAGVVSTVTGNGTREVLAPPPIG